MNILNLGASAYGQSGIPNYVRPLSETFIRMGHRTFLFFSGAWFKKYNWLFKPYLRINREKYAFEYAEVINSPDWSPNFGRPLRDIRSPRMESLFKKYIHKVQPDVLHIHNISGLPSSLVSIAAEKGIKVFHTVHAYGFLCQKQVMVDHEGRPCEGPSDMRKCAACTGQINSRKLKFRARLANTSPGLLNGLVRGKEALDTIRHTRQGQGPETKPERIGKATEEELKKRLETMVGLMNGPIRCNFCVSEDVKKTLMAFGVRKDKLQVLHIGSKIAENQVQSGHELHEPVVIGNIGGVDYYKGQHILIEALQKLDRQKYTAKVYGKYEKDYVDQMMKGREHLPLEFLGSYRHEDLPRLLDEIDIMVLPSICSDTAPQTIFESYSRRVPIVASDGGGFRDFVRNGINGFLFPAGDSQELAARLNDLLSHPEKIASFARNIPTLKTLEENARELLAFYQQNEPECTKWNM
jgi:glycosyltransferase involved in cell wall biosynthesis